MSRITEFPVSRELLCAVESAMRGVIAEGQAEEAKDEIPLDHQFIPGAYARGMRAPAGTLLVGKIHRNPCFNFILTGRVIVFDEGGRKEILAPAFFVSPAGIKRVMYVIEDLIWYNVHGSKETDLEQLELELIAPSYNDLTRQIEGEQ